MHSITGQCELERLARSYQPGAVEDCLTQSKQLSPTGVSWAVLTKVLPSPDDPVFRETPNEWNLQAVLRGDQRPAEEAPAPYQGCPTLDTVVGVVVDRKPICDVEGFRVGLTRNLTAIQNVTRSMVVVEQFVRCPYDSGQIQHEKMLARLWELLKPTQRLTARISKDWTELGFQGDDPQTDFRGCGLLGLFNLLFFAERYNDKALTMLQESLHPQMWYSFAIVGINITSWLKDWLLERVTTLIAQAGHTRRASDDAGPRSTSGRRAKSAAPLRHWNRSIEAETLGRPQADQAPPCRRRPEAGTTLPPTELARPELARQPSSQSSSYSDGSDSSDEEDEADPGLLGGEGSSWERRHTRMEERDALTVSLCAHRFRRRRKRHALRGPYSLREYVPAPTNLHHYFFTAVTPHQAIRTFNFLYVYTFCSFHRYWFQQRPSSILDFPRISRTFRRSFQLPPGRAADELVASTADNVLRDSAMRDSVTPQEGRVRPSPRAPGERYDLRCGASAW
eukprot:Polyplicarium_translucidae@DN2741_c0_g1_i1.p1